MNEFALILNKFVIFYLQIALAPISEIPCHFKPSLRHPIRIASASNWMNAIIR